MAHMWDRGILDQSSWHGLEEVGTMENAEDMIAKGEQTGAWPVTIDAEELFTKSGLKSNKTANVAGYHALAKRSPQIIGTVGQRYNATSPAEWRSLVKAAVEAGARPTGAFSLKDGTRVLGTFEVGISNGLKTNLVLVDSFDGTLRLHGGTTSVRVVCANTLSAALSQSDDWQKVRHTSSLPEKIALLKEGIESAVKTGQKVRDMYTAAEEKKLSRKESEAIFDMLFPAGKDEDHQRGKTRKENTRREAVICMQNSVNNCGNSLATLWNAATFMLDREPDGTARKCRGEADALDSLLFGARAKRLAEVEAIVKHALDVETVLPSALEVRGNYDMTQEAILG